MVRLRPDKGHLETSESKPLQHLKSGAGAAVFFACAKSPLALHLHTLYDWIWGQNGKCTNLVLTKSWAPAEGHLQDVRSDDLRLAEFHTRQAGTEILFGHNRAMVAPKDIAQHGCR